MKELLDFKMCVYEEYDATEAVGLSLLSTKSKAMKSKNKIHKAVQWVIWSSSDPTAVSLTLKALLAFLVLVGVDSAVSEEFANGIVQLYVAIGVLFSASLTAFGLIRKIWLTVR